MFCYRNWEILGACIFWIPSFVHNVGHLFLLSAFHTKYLVILFILKNFVLHLWSMCHILIICLSYYRKNCNMFIVKIVITYTKELYQKFCICWFPDEPNRNEISVVLLANRLLASHFQWFWEEFLACLFGLQEIGVVNLDGICSCCLGLQVGYVNESEHKCGLS